MSRCRRFSNSYPRLSTNIDGGVFLRTLAPWPKGETEDGRGRSGFGVRTVMERSRADHPGGHLIIARVAWDGPTRCGGLDCLQDSPESLNLVLRPEFLLRGSMREGHRTPSGHIPGFVYSWFQRAPMGESGFGGD